VVIIGLTALATLLVIYLADEPNRRGAEAQEQTEASLERAMATYNQFCVSCHGPGGRGYLESGRIGFPLAGTYVGPQDPYFEEGEDERSASERNQTEDDVEWLRREATIASALYEGRGAMPAWGEDFGGELNDEQIRELILLIHEGDWNAVYNHVIEESEGYPTVPPAGGGNAGRTNVALEGEAEDVIEITAPGLAFDPNVVQIPVGGTILLTNDGSGGEHTFVIEGYNDDSPVEMPVGETVEWQVPDDLPPGEYTFYCTIPGHLEAGMVGTITILPALDSSPEAGSPAAEVSPEATAPGAGELPADDEAAAEVELEAFDIGWTQTELTVSKGGAITMVNTGSAPHNFAIDGYRNDEVLEDLPVDGEPVTWQVPDDLEPGTYTFYCEIPGHRAQGMEGTLTVTE
jgi:plastocyanin/mono/diheme cytochrome c family protein